MGDRRLGAIRVTRAPGGRRDLLRAYTVMIDGRAVGKVRRGGTGDFAVPVGEHRLRMKIDWTGSTELSVSVQDGVTAEFSCAPSGGIFDGLRKMVADRDSYIDLRPCG